MPKRVETLTAVEVDARIKRIVADGVQKDFAVGGVEGGGLFLRVDGRKRPPAAAWYLRRRGDDGGKVGLGGYPTVKLKEARAAAEKRLRDAKAVGLGIGAANKAKKEEKRRKAEEARRRANMLTAAGVFAQWQAEAKRRNPRYAGHTAGNDASLFALHIGAVELADGKRFGDKPFDAITPRDLSAVCLAAAKPRDTKGKRRREGAPLCGSTQTRIKVILRKLCDCAFYSGLVSVNLMEGAEFRTLERAIPRTTAPSGHNGALAPAEMPAFIHALCESIASAEAASYASASSRALLFSIFTNSRRKNALRLTRGDVVDGVWTISAEEMKVGENGNHRVYLAPEAVELIEAAPVLAETDYVFASPRTGSVLTDGVFGRVLAALNERRTAAGEKAWIDAEQSTARGADVRLTQHGLARATFETWAEEAIDEKTGQRFSRKAAELNLHHKDKSDGNNGAYLRSPLEEERRRLSAQWVRFCLSETPAALWAKIVRKPAGADGGEAAPAAPQAPEGRGLCAPAPASTGEKGNELDRLRAVYGPTLS